jgi:peptidoglycan endopeptidase LytF
MVGLLGLTTLSPTTALADTDLTIGGTANIANTEGAGAILRSQPSYDATALLTISEGTTVNVTSGPVSGGGSLWYGVTFSGEAGYLPAIFLVSTGLPNPPAATTVPEGGQSAAEPVFTAAQAGSTGTASIAGTNGDGVRCRTTASYVGGVITVVPEGATVSLAGEATGEWQPITCAGAFGYVHTDFVNYSGGAGTAANAAPTPTEQAPVAAKTSVGAENASFEAAAVTGYTTVVGTNGDGLRCRSAAGYSASTITVLAEGSSVAMRGGVQGEWQPVVCAGMNGFAHASFLGAGGGSDTPATPTAPDTGSNTVTGSVKVVGTNGEGLRCRSSASYSASTITVLPEGTSVGTRGAAQGEWQPVVCAGMNGFVHTAFIGAGGTTPTAPNTPTPTPAPTQAPSAPSGFTSGAHAKVTSSLNLRYEPHYNSGVAAVAPAGTVVLITGGAQNGFYPVDWDGLYGYMHGDYLTLTNAALSERGGSAAPEPAPSPPAGDSGSSTGSAMANFALQYVGYPYVWATAGPSSFDCSGFTYWVTKNVVGIDIGRGLHTQVSAGTPVSRANLQPGDLVFFQNTYTWGLSHSGIYIGGGQFIHAENESTGVKISDINSNYYSSRWYGAVRF